MGCWTAYLVRFEDGSVRESEEKYGRWHLAGAEDRASLVKRVLGEGRPVIGDPGTARSCQGIALDLATRRYRFYSCALSMPRAGAAHRESMALHLAGSPGWAGWDVAHAWGGDEELRSLVLPAPPPRPVEDNPAEVCLASRDYWFVGWDPEGRTITVRHDESIADTLAGATCLVSVIDDDATLKHWQLNNTIAPLLAHQGEPMIRALAAEPPYPLASEGAVTDGAVIDVRARRLRYWTPDIVPPPCLARMRETWPGWEIERLPWGHLGHLAAIGERPGELSMTDAELLDARWGDELITIRNHARDALPAESHDLIAPQVLVIDRW
ncbi:hypothetical protein AB0L33_04575 [Streptomyces sp. NPDC052299]|uniref:hypothetical protein n=1 Tax=Streptomyces sp. NPDC052299 TaxID=3155054 RepID=UPI0034303443